MIQHHIISRKDHLTVRRGFTLVELLVASLITAFVLGSVSMSLRQIGRARETCKVRYNAHMRADTALAAQLTVGGAVIAAGDGSQKFAEAARRPGGRPILAQTQVELALRPAIGQGHRRQPQGAGEWRNRLHRRHRHP